MEGGHQQTGCRGQQKFTKVDRGMGRVKIAQNGLKETVNSLSAIAFKNMISVMWGEI